MSKELPACLEDLDVDRSNFAAKVECVVGDSMWPFWVRPQVLMLYSNMGAQMHKEADTKTLTHVVTPQPKCLHLVESYSS